MSSSMGNDSLQRETERQNRIYQEAIARKKKPAQEGPAGDARIEPHFTGTATADTSRPAGPDLGREFVMPHQSASTPPEAAHAGAPAMPHIPPAVAGESSRDLADRISRIPEMCSALMPLQAQEQEAEWSKPFSLTRADMEPWLSFYKGYRHSRLFREGSAGAAFDPAGDLPLDFAVLALLELRQADPKLLLDPPVRINGHVSYAELDDDLRACRNEQEARFLVERAARAHEAQLRAAVDRGREMGNLLYDTLMGDGHVNLIAAWEGVHNRKPTVEELHLMLTAGRTKPAAPKRSQAAPPREEPKEERAPVTPAVVQSPPPEQPPKPVMPQKEAQRERVAPKVPPRPSEAELPVKPVQRAKMSWVERKLDTLSPRQRFLVPIIAAAACSAALVALGLSGLI